MRSAAKVFYLALFAFLKLGKADDHEALSRFHTYDACAVSG
jgi:hypothetical protein